MALSNVEVTLNLKDYLGAAFDPRRTRVYLTTNAEKNLVTDKSTGEVRVGGGSVVLAADGTATATLWAPGADANPASWQTTFHIDYADKGTRERRTVTAGPFTITTSGTLAALIEEQTVPAEYLTTVTQLLDTYTDTAAASATSAAASATSAASSAQLAQDLVLSDLGTSDGQMTAVANNPSSSFYAALSSQVDTLATPSVNQATENAANTFLPSVVDGALSGAIGGTFRTNLVTEPVPLSLTTLGWSLFTGTGSGDGPVTFPATGGPGPAGIADGYMHRSFSTAAPTGNVLAFHLVPVVEGNQIAVAMSGRASWAARHLIEVQFRQSDGATAVGPKYLSPWSSVITGNTWHRVSYTLPVAVPAGATYAQIRYTFEVGGANGSATPTTADSFGVSAAQAEVGVLGPFFTGRSVLSYWTGDPDVSQSKRFVPTSTDSDQRNKELIEDGASLTSLALKAQYAEKVAPTLLGSPTKRVSFNTQQGSTGLPGFTSYKTDANGDPVVGGLVVRAGVDASEGTINWSHDATTGYLMHFTASTNMGAGAGLIGLGIAESIPNSVTALVTSQKGIGVGIGANNTSTAKWTGNGDATTGYAVRGSNLGGVWLRADSSATAGHLIELRANSNATNGQRALTILDHSGNEYLHVDAATRRLTLAQGSATPVHDHRVTWNVSSGVNQQMHAYSGTPGLFFGSQVRLASNILRLEVSQAAAIGSQTFQTALSTHATGGGTAALGFLGATPQTRKNWGAATGVASRDSFNTVTVTTMQLAERVKALIDDLGTTSGFGLLSA